MLPQRSRPPFIQLRLYTRMKEIVKSGHHDVFLHCSGTLIKAVGRSYFQLVSPLIDVAPD